MISNIILVPFRSQTAVVSIMITNIWLVLSWVPTFNRTLDSHRAHHYWLPILVGSHIYHNRMNLCSCRKTVISSSCESYIENKYVHQLEKECQESMLSWSWSSELYNPLYWVLHLYHDDIMNPAKRKKWYG